VFLHLWLECNQDCEEHNEKIMQNGGLAAPASRWLFGAAGRYNGIVTRRRWAFSHRVRELRQAGETLREVSEIFT
jgi:hypothetical protein